MAYQIVGLLLLAALGFNEWSLGVLDQILLDKYGRASTEVIDSSKGLLFNAGGRITEVWLNERIRMVARLQNSVETDVIKIPSMNGGHDDRTFQITEGTFAMQIHALYLEAKVQSLERRIVQFEKMDERLTAMEARMAEPKGV